MPGLQEHLLSVALFVVLAPTFSKANGDHPVIHCYQCHSKYDGDCQHLLVNKSIYDKPCNETKKYAGQAPFCRKITQKIYGWEGKEVMVRRCGWVRDDRECYRVRNWDHSETVCQCFSDRCNFGSMLRGPLSLILLPLLLAVSFVKSEMEDKDLEDIMLKKNV